MKSRRRKNNSGKGLITFGLLLIAAALVLTGKNFLDIARAGEASEKAVEALLPLVQAAKDRTAREKAGVSAADASTAEGKEAIIRDPDKFTVIPDYVLNPKQEMPGLQIDGNNYIGILSVPDIGIVLPVMKNWSYPNLKTAPCCYSGTAYGKDFVICAHNYRVHFGGLKYLPIGAEVLFTDLDGNEFRYEVAEIETLQPTDVEEMISAGWDLSLFTCTVGGASRVTVRCRLL